jgi:hypothetical protein
VALAHRRYRHHDDREEIPMTEISKQTHPAQEAKPEEPKKTEAALDDKQLDTVTGGKSCAAGVHIKDATITTH